MVPIAQLLTCRVELCRETGAVLRAFDMADCGTGLAEFRGVRVHAGSKHAPTITTK